ncbi:hypothetical protein [Chryseobacterium taihuense]|uniref:Uncharacterized protein n=1 Tax=Chryseobacterium taihuense TaxID=1141221 RepID=A0ABY0QZ52_9FLAO|nr:hypothetical protein [Chryseobacterium taihuense]SDM14523.1 hypothetical protein SAMN05216273_11487 [Chryseobacterium taihuense]
MKFKLQFIITILLNFSHYSCQNLTGVYKSKQGSIIELKKNNKYTYVKQDVFSHLVDRKLLSTGNFKRKNDILILKSENKDSKLGEIVTEIKSNLSGVDSINLNLKTNTDAINVFVCNTGLQKNNNIGYHDNCYRLFDGKNIVPTFDSGNFYFSIYPNTDSPLFRLNFDNIQTLYFNSKNYSKLRNSDLSIDIDFDIQKFLNSFFEEEFAIIKGGRIRFMGEDFSMVNINSNNKTE